MSEEDIFDNGNDEKLSEEEGSFNSELILEQLGQQQKAFLLDLLGEIDARHKYNAIGGFFPDEGPLRRELYPKHIQLINKTSHYQELCFIAANRVGKSIAGGYITAMHATGRYPTWWKGKKFFKPTRICVAGETTIMTRDTIQAILLGPINDMGSGMIPKKYLFDNKGRARVTTKAGTPGAKQDAYVEHISGGLSHIVLKSFEQGRESFQGTQQDVVWLDEQAPAEVYDECILRTMTTGGIVILTFTPLKGLTPLVFQFLPGGSFPETPDRCGPVYEKDGKTAYKWLTNCDWDDVPHLKQADKDRMLASSLPHLREARSKGIPVAGPGKIYPVREDEILCKPFEIPPHWPRVYGMDVGWNATSAIFAAIDEQNDCVYIYNEYLGEKKSPVENAGLIGRHAKDWIPGVIDPAAKGLGQTKGKIRYLQEYRELGLELYLADNSVDLGIMTTLTRMNTGRFKVFNTCQKWINEFRMYRRKDNGDVLKERDDLMDATRYLIMSGLRYARVQPEEEDDSMDSRMRKYFSRAGANPITGY